ncbi:MAG TPA: FAD binding domain-containing protein [Candidatus Acidoferrum sp.]|nr:FAD binding domain-containing protein [Candidatus Acidoferrum sp.]
MMRLPLFEFRAPHSLIEAARILSGEGPHATLLAGGTDLLPNMKRRQQVPKTLVSLRHIAELRAIDLAGNRNETRLGSCVTLAEIAADARFRNGLTALSQAASLVATPHIRNMATLGGNLCLDTRCNYYDQNYEWRKAIEFCLKKDGDTCWVAPGSPKCMAVSSTDTAPALIALGAHVRLVSANVERDLPLVDFYVNDGMNFLTRQPNEIVTGIVLHDFHDWRSTYWKLRRRGSFDFPVLSVAAAARIATGGVVEDARIVIGSAASRPLLAIEAGKSLVGRALNAEAIAEAAALASRIAKPLDNTDFDMTWRKKVTAEFVTCALRELRGDDMRVERATLMRTHVN